LAAFGTDPTIAVQAGATRTEDVETHTICVTQDGVLLRLVVDSQTVMEARAVRYRPPAARRPTTRRRWATDGAPR
jgi:hypothetical protein